MSTGAQGDDPIDNFLNSYVAKEQGAAGQANPDLPADVPPVDTPPADTPADVPVDTPQADVPNPDVNAFNIENLTQEQQFEVFNKLTGIDVKSPDQLKDTLDVLGKYPELKKQAELFPLVIEELKKKQNILDFFPDEETFKMVQLAKDPKYKGKEAVLMQVFKSNVDEMKDLDVISLGASLDKSSKISNPLRAAIRKIGLDPDDVLENYDDLSQDDKDLIADTAELYRGKIVEMKSAVKAPEVQGDIMQQIELLDKKAKDDYAFKVNNITPISKGIIDAITELEVDNGFMFKVEMTPEQKQSYAEFLTQAIVSGDFNLDTDEGKRELQEALETEIYVDNRKKILKAYDTHLRTKYEMEFQNKYDNANPLNKKEPIVDKEKAKNPILDIANQMISERT